MSVNFADPELSRTESKHSKTLQHSTPLPVLTGCLIVVSVLPRQWLRLVSQSVSIPAMSPLSSLSVLPVLLLVAGATAQELQKEADPPLNCRREERARRGDRILLDYTGLLADGSTFDRASADFVIGDETVIRGLEEGMLGQCAGEKITMIVPPSLGELAELESGNNK